MTGNGKEGEDSTSRGADWEVVSLTASAYAAAPGPENILPADESKNIGLSTNPEESYHAMFMSGHFVFPPNEHENLPIQYDTNEIQKDSGGQDLSPADEECEVGAKNNSDDVLPEINFYEKEGNISVHGMELEESETLQGLNMFGKESTVYSGTEHSALLAEKDENTTVLCSGNADFSNTVDGTNDHVHSPGNRGSPKKNEVAKLDGSDFPREAWWKRQLASWYNHVKEGNVMYSIFAAAALMGVVLIHRYWQRENAQLQLKQQLDVNAEGLNWMTAPITRFKGIVVGGHQPDLLVQDGAAAANGRQGHGR